ncbi:MAG TPA: hypothetical protein VGN11_12755 [Candidatus Baltobacteraceae bacterium]|nr:hypothetical protein [Candidatus Baltobacteraceae bacterium]
MKHAEGELRRAFAYNDEPKIAVAKVKRKREVVRGPLDKRLLGPRDLPSCF